MKDFTKEKEKVLKFIKPYYKFIPIRSTVFIVFSLLVLVFIILNLGLRLNTNFFNLIKFLFVFNLLLIIFELASKKYKFILNFYNILVFWLFATLFVVGFDSYRNTNKNTGFKFFSNQAANQKSENLSFEKSLEPSNINIQNKFGDISVIVDGKLGSSQILNTYFFEDQKPKVENFVNKEKTYFNFINTTSQFNLRKIFSLSQHPSYELNLSSAEVDNLSMNCSGENCNFELSNSSVQNINLLAEDVICKFDFTGQTNESSEANIEINTSNCRITNLLNQKKIEFNLNNSEVVMLNDSDKFSTDEFTLNMKSANISINIPKSFGLEIEFYVDGDLIINDQKQSQRTGLYSGQNENKKTLKIKITADKESKINLIHPQN